MAQLPGFGKSAALLLSVASAVFSSGTDARADPLDISRRRERQDVQETLVQAMLTIADLRIADHRGRHSPYYDSCSTGDGCRSEFPLENPRILLGVPTPPFWPRVRNFPDEWASGIHALTQLIPTSSGQAPFAIPDSNMFVTASILYPLSFVRGGESGPLRDAIRAAIGSLEHYKRGPAYSFWREHASIHAGHRVVGPLNIPPRLLEVLAKGARAIGSIVGGQLPDGGNPPSDHGTTARPGWVEAMQDPDINPVGMEAFFNIPNDADDTALAMIAMSLFPQPDASRLDELTQLLMRHRDLDRAYEDGRDDWKGVNSGAFLTWLKDEDLPLAEAMRPSDGSMPFGKNNVDCVVNANVAFALGLAGRGSDPAVLDTLTALNRAVDREAWPRCGLYYPHQMMLPYTLTRAYRDGSLTHPGRDAALARIVIRLLADQREVAVRDRKRKGAFSGGFDRTHDLATGLAVNALLNVGREIPERLGLAREYQVAIESGIDYLIRAKALMPVQYPARLAGITPRRPKAAVWAPGLFFSASVQGVAQWRSEAYTAAIVAEAMAKYLLGWDQDQKVDWQSRYVRLVDGRIEY